MGGDWYREVGRREYRPLDSPNQYHAAVAVRSLMPYQLQCMTCVDGGTLSMFVRLYCPLVGDSLLSNSCAWYCNERRVNFELAVNQRFGSFSVK